MPSEKDLTGRKAQINDIHTVIIIKKRENSFLVEYDDESRDWVKDYELKLLPSLIDKYKVIDLISEIASNEVLYADDIIKLITEMKESNA